jgi:hypothetical protein
MQIGEMGPLCFRSRARANRRVLWRKKRLTGLREMPRDNSAMLRQLQSRADDLFERLMICELEMQRSRTLEKKLQAYLEFGTVVDRIDALRRDLEELGVRKSMVSELDRRVAGVMRSAAYRVAEWLQLYANLSWYVASAPVDPGRLATPC